MLQDGDGDGDGDGDSDSNGDAIAHLVNGPPHHEKEDDEDEDEEILVLEAATAADEEEKYHGQQQQQLRLHSLQMTLVIRQIPYQGLSFQIWPAASTLVSLLDSPTNPILPLLSNSNSSFPIRILELGSGTGLVGIAAASLLHAHVTLTDLPHVLPNLQFNANANAPATASNGGTVDVRCLRWGDPNDMGSLGHRYDLLLATDVVYHDHLFYPLLQTLSFYLQGPVALVMVHLRRWKKDAIFFKKARKVFDVRAIHTDEPLPGSRTGVTVYHFIRKHQCNG